MDIADRPCNLALPRRKSIEDSAVTVEDNSLHFKQLHLARSYKNTSRIKVRKFEVVYFKLAVLPRKVQASKMTRSCISNIQNRADDARVTYEFNDSVHHCALRIS